MQMRPIKTQFQSIIIRIRLIRVQFSPIKQQIEHLLTIPDVSIVVMSPLIPLDPLAPGH